MFGLPRAFRLAPARPRAIHGPGGRTGSRATATAGSSGISDGAGAQAAGFWRGALVGLLIAAAVGLALAWLYPPVPPTPPAVTPVPPGRRRSSPPGSTEPAAPGERWPRTVDAGAETPAISAPSPGRSAAQRVASDAARSARREPAAGDPALRRPAVGAAFGRAASRRDFRVIYAAKARPRGRSANVVLQLTPRGRPTPNLIPK